MIFIFQPMRWIAACKATHGECPGPYLAVTSCPCCSRRLSNGVPVVSLPDIDKALRQGRGDRSGWRRCTADVIVLEGWFVGVRPTDNNGSATTSPSQRSACRLTSKQLARQNRATAGLSPHLGRAQRPVAAAHAQAEFHRLKSGNANRKIKCEQEPRCWLEIQRTWNGFIRNDLCRHSTGQLQRSRPMLSLISTRIDGCVGSGSAPELLGLAVFRFRDWIDEALGAATQDRLADGHGTVVRQLLPWLSRWHGAGCAWPWMFSSSERPWFSRIRAGR